MKYFLSIIVIIGSAISISFGQKTTKELLELHPDEPAKAGSNIYLIKLPEWDKTFAKDELDIRLTIRSTDSHFRDFLSFGSWNYPKSESHTRGILFGQHILSPKGPGNWIPLLADNYLQTNEEDLFVKFELEERKWDTFKLFSARFKTYTEAEIKELDTKAILNALGIKGQQYKIEKIDFCQTQDLGHLFIDITFNYSNLEGDYYDRKWVTLKADDFSVVNAASVPRSNPETGTSVKLTPFGIISWFPSMINISSGSFGHGNNLLAGDVTLPGKDIVYATYRPNEFRSDVLAKVDMTSGKISFVAPPKTGMIKTGEDLVHKSRYVNATQKFKDPMWKLNNSVKGHEGFLYYNESDGTYMTCEQYTSSGIPDLQIVIQNKEGEYIERAKEIVPIGHYRIRSIENNEVVSEYTLLNAEPLKTSFDGKYMVFVEGLFSNKVLRLRNRKTGELIDTVPYVESHYDKDKNIVECKSGMMVVHSNGNSLSSLEYKE